LLETNWRWIFLKHAGRFKNGEAVELLPDFKGPLTVVSGSGN